MTPVSYKHVDVARVTDEILNREGAQGWRLSYAEEMVGHEPVEGSAPMGDRYPFIRLWFSREEAR